MSTHDMLGHHDNVSRFADADTLALAAAERIARIIIEAIEQRGRCSVVLGGGTTYLRTYALLAERKDIEWNRAHLFIGDERFVPPDDASSNRDAIRKAMDRITIPKTNLHLMRTEGVTIEEAARMYEEEIEEYRDRNMEYRERGGMSPNSKFHSPNSDLFDLVLLGMGPDGHTLSIFPGSEETRNPSDRLVIPVYDSPKPPAQRITLTYKAVNQARHILFVVSGEEKKAALEATLYGAEDISKWPAQGVRPEEGEVEWMIQN